jgi:hypothetical protein
MDHWMHTVIGEDGGSGSVVTVGEPDGKGGTSAFLGLDGDMPPLGLCQLAGDGQAQTRARLPVPIVGALPPSFEDPRVISRSDPGALILDREP